MHTEQTLAALYDGRVVVEIVVTALRDGYERKAAELAKLLADTANSYGRDGIATTVMGTRTTGGAS